MYTSNHKAPFCDTTLLHLCKSLCNPTFEIRISSFLPPSPNPSLFFLSPPPFLHFYLDFPPQYPLLLPISPSLQPLPLLSDPKIQYAQGEKEDSSSRYIISFQCAFLSFPKPHGNFTSQLIFPFFFLRSISPSLPERCLMGWKNPEFFLLPGWSWVSSNTVH